MRIRRKPWARPELAACPYHIDRPDALRGHWRTAFARPDAPFWLELGCGKGGFAAPFAAQNPGINLLALDLKSEVLALARRRAEQEFSAVGRPVDNLLLASQDIERLGSILTPAEPVSCIVINFCNPWPKERHHKHRLTHPRQLLQYRALLEPQGRLVFKTDDDGLFADTLDYLPQGGFSLAQRLDDLPPDHPAAHPMSEHELMFRERGVAIKYFVAVKGDRL